MRAVVIHKFGTPSGMAVVEVPAPQAGPGQVVIATEAIGVGGVDAVIRRGTVRGAGLYARPDPGQRSRRHRGLGR